LLLGFVGFCLVPGSIVFFVTGLGPYDVPSKSRELDSVIARSKELGLPMTQTELVPSRPDEKDNAAPLVISLSKGLTGQPSVSTTNMRSNETDLAVWVANNESILNGAQQELAMKPAWFVERDYDDFIDVAFPEFARIKNLVKGYAYRGEIRAKKGDVDGALTDLRTARDLATRVSKEPTLIAMLVAIAIESIAFRAVESYADAWFDDAKSLKRLESTLTETNRPFDPTNAMRGEFYAALSTCRRVVGTKSFFQLSTLYPDSDSEPNIDLGPVARNGLPPSLLGKATLAYVARRLNNAFEQRPNDGTRWREFGTDIDPSLLQNQTVSAQLGQLFVANYKRVGDALKRSDVNQDLAVAFVRSMRFRAEHGAWPDSLKAIDADFDDPFSGGSIQATFAPDEIRVWSIGIDRANGGGRLNNEGKTHSDDIVFVWPATLRRRID
jgi:hypothetical protein